MNTFLWNIYIYFTLSLIHKKILNRLSYFVQTWPLTLFFCLIYSNFENTRNILKTRTCLRNKTLISPPIPPLNTVRHYFFKYCCVSYPWKPIQPDVRCYLYSKQKHELFHNSRISSKTYRFPYTTGQFNMFL